MDSESVVDPDVTSGPAEASGFPPFVLGPLILALMLLYFWLSGALLPDAAISLTWSPAQITGMALTYSTTPAFLVAALLYSQTRTRTNLDQLVRFGKVKPEAVTSRVAVGAGLGLASNVGATILGLVLGLGQNSADLVIDSFGTPAMSIVLSVAVGNVVTWLAVVHVLLRRGLAAIELLRLGRTQTTVDLLRPNTLLPFGRIATLHLLMVAIALSFTVFQSLDAEVRWVNYSAALTAGIPAGLVLVLLPMLGIRMNVRGVKRDMLEKLDEAIEHADREFEPDALRYMGDLLRQRESIEHAREWPLDTTAFSRIAIYFVIPPIAWVGGALVEILVQGAL